MFQTTNIICYKRQYGYVGCWPQQTIQPIPPDDGKNPPGLWDVRWDSRAAGSLASANGKSTGESMMFYK